MLIITKTVCNRKKKKRCTYHIYDYGKDVFCLGLTDSLLFSFESIVLDPSITID